MPFVRCNIFVAVHNGKLRYFASEYCGPKKQKRHHGLDGRKRNIQHREF